jgi:hypothetical protein
VDVGLINHGVVRTIAANKRDGAVTRREVREASGLPDHRVIALLQELVALEYVEIICGSFGKVFRYRIATTPAATNGIPGLTTRDELRVKLTVTKAPNLATPQKGRRKEVIARATGRRTRSPAIAFACSGSSTT